MFKGWDFTELADEWGMYLPDDMEDDVALAYHVRYILEQNPYSMEGRFIKKMAKDLQEYLSVLAKFDCGYLSGVWKAMSEVEDPTLVLYITFSNTPLIGGMWS